MCYWDLPDIGLEFHADFPYPDAYEGVTFDCGHPLGPRIPEATFHRCTVIRAAAFPRTVASDRQ